MKKLTAIVFSLVLMAFSSATWATLGAEGPGYQQEIPCDTFTIKP